MSVIKGVLLEERERNLLMQNQYLKEIAALPKGSIVKKIKPSGIYFYLAYRNGNKVVSDYLGTDIEKVEQVRQAIEKRKHLESLIKRLNEELKLIAKAVK